MSSGEIIALLCVLCLVPLCAAGSVIVFALGKVRCGRLMDPYYDEGGSGSKRDHCPLNPRDPRGDRGVRGPGDRGPSDENVDWWAQFEREFGSYVVEQEQCPSGHGATETEPVREAGGSPTRA